MITSFYSFVDNCGWPCRTQYYIKLEPASDTALFGRSADGLGECVRHIVDIGTCK